ncbi:MAG: DUF2299 domain-containing protein [Dehalococcoidia bacterium]|nr:DUF2299 domain-containing protein [Dehalococcoidia bacterium]
MRELFKSVVSNALAALLIIGGPAVVGVLGSVQSIDWYLIVLGIMAAASMALFATNQVHDFRRRRDRGFATRRDKDIEATLRRWLDGERLSIQTDSQANAVFQFKATDQQSRVMIVAKSRNLPDFILIGGKWDIPQDAQGSFAKMPITIREDMIWECRLEMLCRGVGYQGIEYPFTSVGFEVRVPCDETCTKPVFLDRFNTARYSYATLTELIVMAFRRAGMSVPGFAAPKQQLTQQQVSDKATPRKTKAS